MDNDELLKFKADMQRAHMERGGDDHEFKYSKAADPCELPKFDPISTEELKKKFEALEKHHCPVFTESCRQCYALAEYRGKK